jgi:ATP dependent DNA ligase-like protein
MLQPTLPAGFVAPCFPTKAHNPPSGEMWLHEIKHDGFRIIARKNGERVKLDSRPGNDLTYRFPLIVETLVRLCARSCIIDGEAVACGDDGRARWHCVETEGFAVPRGFQSASSKVCAADASRRRLAGSKHHYGFREVDRSDVSDEPTRMAS